MRRIAALVSLLAILVSCRQNNVGIDIVPVPESVRYGHHGQFGLCPGIRICALSDDLVEPAEIFAGQMEQITGMRPEVVSGKASGRRIVVKIDTTLAEEEYYIGIRRKSVHIDGGSPRGVFHGMQTLRQIILQCSDDMSVPSMEVRDKPFFGYRGMMLDVSRHFSSVEEVKEFIDILSMHKINKFHWHLTDDQGWRIEIKKYPRLTEVGAVREETVVGHARTSRTYDGKPYGEGMYYTQEQIRDVVRYASARFIDVIPEIEMPGHAMAALASYPELGCKGKGYKVATTWGIFDDVFCAGKEEVFTFFEDVIDEVVPLFPSKYIHIGGDECPKTVWKKCPFCQERIREEGLRDEAELQSYFMKRMEQYINSKGKAVIGWEEILDGGVSPTATVMCWKHPEIGIKAAKNGNDVIMVNSQYSYFDYYQTDKTEDEPMAIGGNVPVSKVYSYDPYDKLTGKDREPVIGIQANLWREYIPDMQHVEYMVLPRIAALSENGWAYDRKDYDSFLSRMQSFRRLYDLCGYNYARHIFNNN